ncbi:hypothetical protein PoB_000093000 [Plakobranchus ocellatus]|uniref:Uncharacterized protein n=1 Tax=Plakobranchus ocellatus TaxID=259542 RepID=A0AAV3XVJ6_9GAST|nr:hypothetical protein PoB_000093000 [Plakobranchus ocellatus]
MARQGPMEGQQPLAIMHLVFTTNCISLLRLPDRAVKRVLRDVTGLDLAALEGRALPASPPPSLCALKGHPSLMRKKQNGSEPSQVRPAPGHTLPRCKRGMSKRARWRCKQMYLSQIKLQYLTPWAVSNSTNHASSPSPPCSTSPPTTRRNKHAGSEEIPRSPSLARSASSGHPSLPSFPSPSRHRTPYKPKACRCKCRTGAARGGNPGREDQGHSCHPAPLLPSFPPEERPTHKDITLCLPSPLVSSPLATLPPRTAQHQSTRLVGSKTSKQAKLEIQ